MRAIPMRGWVALISVAVVLAAAGAWMFNRSPLSSAAPAGEARSPGAGWGMIRPTTDAPADALPGASQAMSAQQVRDRLFRDGSFAGTEPPGGWCVSGGKLQACPDLRTRFEYYILGLGEVSIDDIRTLVADEAQRANGKALAQAIMAIWDKYWQLRTYNWRNKFDQSDRSTWMAVFSEQKLVRRQILGEDWAKAFFAQDEQDFQQYYTQLESGQPPPPDPGEPVPQMAPGKDPAAVRAERVARYGEAAADRLDKVDEAWADWERRLAGARTEWNRLQAANNLSDTQRRAEMQRYIDAHFKADEHLRVEALLHL